MRLVRLFLLMVLAASVVACSPTRLPSSASATPSPVVKEPYKIGMVISLTGFATFPGTEVRDAVVMEVERINAAGGVNGHQLELIVEDSASDPTKAVAALTKLARQDKVLAVIGDTFSTIQPATEWHCAGPATRSTSPGSLSWQHTVQTCGVLVGRSGAR